MARVFDDSPDSTTIRVELGNTCHAFGVLLILANRPEDAAAQFQEVIAIREAMVNDFPSVPRWAHQCRGAGAKLFRVQPKQAEPQKESP